MNKPRCIHWHHIKLYRGLRQKIGYVVRRLLGMKTQSADLIGCKHEQLSQFIYEELRKAFVEADNVANDLLIYGTMSGVPKGIALGDWQSEYPEELQYIEFDADTNVDLTLTEFDPVAFKMLFNTNYGPLNKEDDGQ